MTDRYKNNTKTKVKMMLEENDIPYNSECINYIAMKWIEDYKEQIDQIDSENGDVDVYEDDSYFEIDLDDVLLYHTSFQKAVFGGLRVKDVVAHFDSGTKYEVWVGNCFYGNNITRASGVEDRLVDKVYPAAANRINIEVFP